MVKPIFLVLLSMGLSWTTGLGQNGLTDLFAPLLNHTWKSEGQWADGTAFSQEVYFETNLEGNLVVAYSEGFVNKQQTKMGQRNLGLRRWDSAAGKYLFWEYDVFGGLTKGTMTTEDNFIRYHYQYGGVSLTDQWEYVDDQTYNFKVGQWDGKQWTATYLETSFKRIDSSPLDQIFSSLKQTLPGQWRSKAWDGWLDEHWWVDTDGNLRQTAAYSEEGTVSYRAKNKIEMIDDQLILISIIEGSDPRIFQATFFDDKQVVFFNSMYENPSRVTYKLMADHFERTIGGMESDQPTRYTFIFNKTN